MIKNPKYYESPHKIAMAPKGTPVLLALSGGADSTSLLYNLVSEGKEAGYTVFAAHVNHNIRLCGYDNEAARDEEFCRRLCEKLGVKLFVLNAHVPEIAKQTGESIEGAARRVRYDFFSEIMEENDIPILVTAHNANDNFETQLFNLCRGSGISGMVGIPKCRPLHNGKLVVRPILSGNKAEILEFCSENGISYVEDSTNSELDATRNKLRNLIIPELADIFPAVQRSAYRLSEAASEISDYMKGEAQSFIESFCEIDSELCIPLNEFKFKHVALRKSVITLISKELDLSLESVHIDSILSLAERGVPHSKIDLPSGFACSIEDGCVCFAKSCEEKQDDGYNIPLIDVTYIPNAEFCVSIGKKLNDGAYSPYASATLYSDKIKKGLLSGLACVRTRTAGDKIIDGGNTKKLKKLMCDKKIPLKERNILPLICLDGEIVYAPLCAICDEAKRRGEGEVEIFIYKKS